MNYEDFRVEMNEYRNRSIIDSLDRKDSSYVYVLLHKFYEKRAMSSPEAMLFAHRVIEEWTLADDVNMRMDAYDLIRHFRIASLASALEAAAARSAVRPSKEAPSERMIIARILDSLK